MSKFIVGIVLLLSLCSASLGQEHKEPIFLSFGEALKKAYTMNPQVLMADARLQQALARIGEARASLLPQISAAIKGARQNEDLRSTGIRIPGLKPEIGPFNTFDARGQLTMTLFDPSALERLNAASRGSQLSRAQLIKVREDILVLMSTMYTNALRSQQTVSLMSIVVKRDEQSFHVAEVQFKQGTGSLLDLKKSQADLAQSQYLFAQSQAQAIQDRLDIMSALKIPFEQAIILKDDGSFEKTMKSRIHAAQKENADVGVAKAELLSQKAELAAARADFLPKVTGLANYGRSGESPSESSNTYGIGLQITLPIWEGGLQQAQLNEAKAEVRESQENLEDVTRQSQAKIMNAWATLNEAKALVNAKSAETEFIKESIQTSQSRLNSGLGSTLDMSQAQATNALVEDERNEAQAYLTTAQINLIHLLGGLEELVKE